MVGSSPSEVNCLSDLKFMINIAAARGNRPPARKNFD